MASRIHVERKESRKGETHARLYAPKRDTEAFAYDPETGDRLEEPAMTVAPVEVASPRPTMKLGSRIAIIICIFIFAAMFVYILSGYANIAKAYSAINDLNSSIDELNIRISALNASIECAVTIDEAQSYAISHGMQYPTQNQYIGKNEIIPSYGYGSYGSGNTISGSLSDTSDNGTDAEPEG